MPRLYDDYSATSPASKCAWWEDGAEEGELFAAVRRIQQRQPARELANLRNARLYADAPVLGLMQSRFLQQASASPNSAQLSLNVIRSCADSLQNKLLETRVRPWFVSNGGTYKIQRRAQKMTRYCEAAFRACKVDEVIARCVLDCLIFDVGVAKVFSEHGKLKVERCFPGEFIWEELDGAYQAPRSVYTVRYVDRAKLRATFPKKKAEIEKAPTPPDVGLAIRDSSTDQVLVVEGWHLESAPDAGDGKHTIALQNAVLLEEEFCEEEFPFMVLRFTEDLLGFGGTPLASLLVGIQISINRIIRDIEQSQYLLGNARVFVERGSKVLASRLTNMIGGIVEYTGTRPEVLTGNAIDPQAMQLLLMLWSKAFELAGISQMMSQGTKPTGLETGAAIRAFVQETSPRFKRLTDSIAAFGVGIAERMIRENRKLAEENPDFELVHVSRSKMERISWRDCALDEGEYMISAMPTSALSKDPAERLATIGEWVNAGWIDQAMAMKLADMPDLDAANDELTAANDLVHDLIDRMIEDREPAQVETFYDLPMCIRVGMRRFMQSKLQRVSDESLGLIRDFIVDAQTELLKQNPAPTPAAPQTPLATPPGLVNGAAPWSKAA